MLRKAIVSLAAASLVATPAHAATSQYETGEIHPGTFVGARLKLPMGRHKQAEPLAGLAIAPTTSRVSPDGMLRTRIGEGIALNLRPKAEHSLTLAGVPASQALGSGRRTEAKTERKMGVSSSGWVAIGLGAVAIGAAVYGLILLDEARDNSD